LKEGEQMGIWGYIIVGAICAFLGFMTCALVSAGKISENDSVNNELRAVIKYYREKENNDKLNKN
jgi:hypothetical protein